MKTDSYEQLLNIVPEIFLDPLYLLVFLYQTLGSSCVASFTIYWYFAPTINAQEPEKKFSSKDSLTFCLLTSSSITVSLFHPPVVISLDLFLCWCLPVSVFLPFLVPLLIQSTSVSVPCLQRADDLSCLPLIQSLLFIFGMLPLHFSPFGYLSYTVSWHSTNWTITLVLFFTVWPAHSAKLVLTSSSALQMNCLDNSIYVLSF